MRRLVTPKNNHANDTLPNSETQTNTNASVTVSTVANKDMGIGKITRRKGTTPNRRFHGTNDGNKQNDQSTTLIQSAVTVVTQDTKLAIAATNEKNPQPNQPIQEN